MMVHSRMLSTGVASNDRDNRKWLQAALFRLLIEPDILQAPAIEDAVDHQRDALDVRAQAGAARVVKDDRAGIVLRQSALDRPEQLLAAFNVRGARLLLDQPVDFGVAVIVPVQA